MAGMLDRFTTLRTTLVGVAAFALAGLVLPTSSAQAADPGLWAASWHYHSTTGFQFSAETPGALAIGRGTDDNGTRTMNGALVDQLDDGRCVRVQVYGVGQGYLGGNTACGYGVNQRYSVGPFDRELMILVQRLAPDGVSIERSTYLWIPSSADDPELRSVLGGARWAYDAAGAGFWYQLTRGGMRLSGLGEHSPSGSSTWIDRVQKLNTGPGCATGRAFVNNTGAEVSGATCTTSEIPSTTELYYTGTLNVEGCYQPLNGALGCTRMMVPRPS